MMQKSLKKHKQDLAANQKDYTAWLTGICSQNARMVQHTRLNQYSITKWRERPQIISTDAEKASEIIQLSFLIKTLKQTKKQKNTEIEQNYLNRTKATYEKFIVKIIQLWRLKAFQLK